MPLTFSQLKRTSVLGCPVPVYWYEDNTGEECNYSCLNIPLTITTSIQSSRKDLILMYLLKVLSLKMTEFRLSLFFIIMQLCLHYEREELSQDQTLLNTL